jgi:hypothetical protein
MDVAGTWFVPRPKPRVSSKTAVTWPVWTSLDRTLGESNGRSSRRLHFCHTTRVSMLPLSTGNDPPGLYPTLGPIPGGSDLSRKNAEVLLLGSPVGDKPHRWPGEQAPAVL